MIDPDLMADQGLMFVEDPRWSIGFSGTRKGMTLVQASRVDEILGRYWDRGVKRGRHGMCVGADAQFHALLRRRGFHIVGHPGVWIDGSCRTRASVVCDETMTEKPFVERDHDIVDASVAVVAAPGGRTEEARGSGTWATIRYARKKDKKLYVAYPDGGVDER